MKKVQRKQREGGFIISAELIFIATILVIGLVAGWIELRDAMLEEIEDVSEAIGSIDQTFQYTGAQSSQVGPIDFSNGSQFLDAVDVFPDGENITTDSPISAGEGL